MKLKTMNIVKVFFYSLCLPIVLFFEPGLIGDDIKIITSFAFYLLVPVAFITLLFTYKSYNVPINSKKIVHIKRISFYIFIIYPLNILASLVLAFGVNIALDNREQVYNFTGIVTQKYSSNSNHKSKLYSVYIHDEERDQEEHFYVEYGHYKKLKVGDRTTFEYNAGRFGVTWRFDSFINMF